MPMSEREKGREGGREGRRERKKERKKKSLFQALSVLDLSLLIS